MEECGLRKIGDSVESLGTCAEIDAQGLFDLETTCSRYEAPWHTSIFGIYR
jgi:hypothetical protein